MLCCIACAGGSTCHLHRSCTLAPQNLMDLQQLCPQTFSVDVRARYQMLLPFPHHDTVAEDAAVTFFGEDPVLS